MHQLTRQSSSRHRMRLPRQEETATTASRKRSVEACFLGFWACFWRASGSPRAFFRAAPGSGATPSARERPPCRALSLLSRDKHATSETAVHDLSHDVPQWSTVGRGTGHKHDKRFECLLCVTPRSCGEFCLHIAPQDTGRTGVFQAQTACPQRRSLHTCCQRSSSACDAGVM